MNCQEVVEYMHRYLDQDLDPEETAQMYRHIAVCPACAEKFSVLKSLSRELEDLPAVSPPYSLVDAILPQLEAIDRARIEQTGEEMTDKPSVMVPEVKSVTRRVNWWGTVAGRAVMGTAAAALILGVAIFSYEPKMLSDAEMPFNETNLPVSVNGSNGSQELPENQAQLQSRALSDLAGEEEQGKQPASASLEPTDSGETPVEKSELGDSLPAGKNDAGVVADPPNEDTKTPSRKDGKTLDEEAAKTKNESGNSLPAQQAPDKTQSPQQDVKSDSPGSGETQDSQGPAEKLTTPASNHEQEIGKIDLYGISNIGPQQLPSPDGLYSASLEIDKLVVYRLPAAAEQLPEAMITVPFNGEWVNGEWSTDSKIFRYTILVDQKEVKHEFNVESPIDSVELQKANLGGEMEPVDPANNP